MRRRSKQTWLLLDATTTIFRRSLGPLAAQSKLYSALYSEAASRHALMYAKVLDQDGPLEGVLRM